VGQVKMGFLGRLGKVGRRGSGFDEVMGVWTMIEGQEGVAIGRKKK